MENPSVGTACRRCGEAFTPRTSGGKPQIYCSRRCYTRASGANSRRAHAPIRTTTCGECGGPVDQPEKGRPRRFCTEKCKARAHNRSQRRLRLPIRDPSPAPRICARGAPYCTQSFIPRRKDQVYCSPRCSSNAGQLRRWHGADLRQGVTFEATCVECGQPYDAKKNNARYCSAGCRRRFTAREESRKRGARRPDHVPYIDREIFERDSWVCQICQLPVDPTADRRHPDGATIDHVVPLSKGGADDPSNVVTAHWRCNRDKGNRT